MKAQIPLFGRMIPLEIDEEKIPGLIERFFPVAAKAIEQSKSLGIDLSPAIQRMIGTVAVPAPAPAPVPAQDWAPPPEGWVRDHTGQLVKLADLALALQQKNEPTAKECSKCLRAHPILKTGSIATCGACFTDPSRPSYLPAA